jgi:hypothetical protein
MIIALCLMSCIYLYVRFTTYWHVDIARSGTVTVCAIATIAFCMINIDASAICLVPSMILLVLFVQFQIYKPLQAIVSTLTIFATILILQWLLAPSVFGILGKFGSAITQSGQNRPIIESILTTYLDGYNLQIWDKHYQSFDFLKLDNAAHRILEAYVIALIGAVFIFLFLLKISFFMKKRRSKLEIASLQYRPEVPIIFVLGLAFALITPLQVVEGGDSPTYLFLQVLTLLLICLMIYTFFLGAGRGGFQFTKSPRWSELVYKPIAFTASGFLCILSLINFLFYVAPYRGSNYPSVYDVMQKRWGGTGCVTVSYAPPVYAVALRAKVMTPHQNDEGLDTLLKEGNHSEGDCIVLPLIARDGVTGLHEKTIQPGNLEVMLSKANYEPIDRIVLPFYQKDPMYPITTFELQDPYKHAHGAPGFGFGGTEDIVIYKLARKVSEPNPLRVDHR